MGGCHVGVLDGAGRSSDSGLATLPEGCEAGLARFEQGGLIGAALHLHGLAETDPNVAAVRARASLHDTVLIAFGQREQGFLVPSGNPKKIAGIADVAQQKLRIAVRPKGAGAQLLLLTLLERAQVSFDQLTLASPPCPTGPDIAQAIRSGRADCGIATRSVANAAGLDFVPIVWERFDLALRQRDYFRPPLQSLLRFLTTPAMAARAKELGGYDLATAGQVRYAP